MSENFDDFRVSVSLEQYFTDERKRCYMLVNGKKQVQWLKKRLQAAFKLDEFFCLISRGHLLLSDERLSVLRPDESVEVIPLKRESIAKDKENLAQNCQLEHGCDDSGVRKRKLNWEKLPKETDKVKNPLDPPLRKPVQETSQSQVTSDDVSPKDSEEDLPKVESLQDVKCQALAILDEYCHTTELPVSEQPSRRRVRSRKRRRRPANSLPSPTSTPIPISIASCITVPTPSSTCIPHQTPSEEDTKLVLHNASLEPRVARIVHTQ